MPCPEKERISKALNVARDGSAIVCDSLRSLLIISALIGQIEFFVVQQYQQHDNSTKMPDITKKALNYVAFVPAILFSLWFTAKHLYDNNEKSYISKAQAVFSVSFALMIYDVLISEPTLESVITISVITSILTPILYMTATEDTQYKTMSCYDNGNAQALELNNLARVMNVFSIMFTYGSCASILLLQIYRNMAHKTVEIGLAGKIISGVSYLIYFSLAFFSNTHKNFFNVFVKISNAMMTGALCYAGASGLACGFALLPKVGNYTHENGCFNDETEKKIQIAFLSLSTILAMYTFLTTHYPLSAQNKQLNDTADWLKEKGNTIGDGVGALCSASAKAIEKCGASSVTLMGGCAKSIRGCGTAVIRRIKDSCSSSEDSKKPLLIK